jgi:hypothetical protein
MLLFIAIGVVVVVFMARLLSPLSQRGSAAGVTAAVPRKRIVQGEI